MILLHEGEFGTINGKPIVRWEVRFVTLRGWFQSLQAAVLDANLINQPFELIKPHPCAVAEDGDWEPAC